MSPRALQILQGLLITAVTMVLALVVLTSFLRVLRPPDPERIAARAHEFATTTTLGPTGTSTPSDTSAAPPVTDTAVPPVEEVDGVIPGGCQEPGPRNPQGTVVRVFYTCGSGPIPDVTGNVFRTVPATQLVMNATLTEMVKGPDQREREIGFTSVFSEASSGVFGGATIDSDRTAFIDFVGLEALEGLDQPTVANALVASLNATVFQFGSVTAVEYRLGGSCQSFWALMGTDCVTITRGEWERQVAAWAAQG